MNSDVAMSLNTTSVNLSNYSVIYSVNVNMPYQYAYIVEDSALSAVLDDPSEPIADANNEEIKDETYNKVVKDETYDSGFNYMEMYSVPGYGINGCRVKGIGNTYKQVQSYDADQGLHFSSNIDYVGFTSKDAKDFNFYTKDWRFLSSNVETTDKTSCVITYSPRNKIGSVSQDGITAQVEGQLILYYRVPKTLTLTNYLEVTEWKSQTAGGPTDSLRDEIKNHNGFGHLSSLYKDDYNFYSIGFFTGNASVRFKMEYEVHSVEVTKSVSNYTLTSQMRCEGGKLYIDYLDKILKQNEIKPIFITDKKITIEGLEDLEELTVLGDQSMLDQVIYNLVCDKVTYNWNFVQGHVDEEDCFVKGEDDYYSCIVDRDIDKKIKMMFKTIGIKDDFVLTPHEFGLIEKFDIEKIRKDKVRQ